MVRPQLRGSSLKCLSHRGKVAAGSPLPQHPAHCQWEDATQKRRRGHDTQMLCPLLPLMKKWTKHSLSCIKSYKIPCHHSHSCSHTCTHISTVDWKASLGILDLRVSSLASSRSIPTLKSKFCSLRPENVFIHPQKTFFWLENILGIQTFQKIIVLIRRKFCFMSFSAVYEMLRKNLPLVPALLSGLMVSTALQGNIYIASFTRLNFRRKV